MLELMACRRVRRNQDFDASPGRGSDPIGPQLDENGDHVDLRPARHKTSFSQLTSIIDSNVGERSGEFKHVPASDARGHRRRALSLDTPPSSGQPRSVQPSCATEAATENIQINRNM